MGASDPAAAQRARRAAGNTLSAIEIVYFARRSMDDVFVLGVGEPDDDPSRNDPLERLGRGSGCP